MRLDKSLVAELEQDLVDARRMREQILNAHLMGDPTEALSNQLWALEVADKWIARYERNLEQARSEEEADE